MIGLNAKWLVACIFILSAALPAIKVAGGRLVNIQPAGNSQGQHGKHTH
jgi:hypothetical protein